MKVTLLTLLLLLLLSSAKGQTLILHDIDPSNYPVISGDFYAFDENGDQLTDLAPQDFRLSENGAQRTILNVTCPENPKPKVLSAVLTVDISGSMGNGNLDIAKAAAEAWVEAMPDNGTECAVTVFDTGNLLMQDFTIDRNALKVAISKLETRGGTLFDAALVDPQAGALLVAEKGKHRKVIILITDGEAEANAPAIINKAKSMNASIFCVTISNDCPEILKDICNGTGGLYFENIVDKKTAIGAFIQILNIAKGTEPCTISWESGPDCEYGREVNITIPSHSMANQAKYSGPERSLIKLNTEINGISLGYIEPGTSKDTTVKVTAQQSDIHIKNIASTNPAFTIADYGGSPPPFTLAEGDSRNLTIRFSPQDSSSYFTRIEIEKDKCRNDIIFLISYQNFKNSKTLRVTHPNGGEEFAEGSDTVITWEGILPEDKVSLDYSTNDGKSWVRITDNANGLKHKWNIPDTPSDSCLVKARKMANDDRDGHLVLGLGSINAFEPSPGWTSIATGGGSGSIYLWDIDEAEVIDTLIGHKDEILSISWNPERNKIATGGRDSAMKIWDIETGNEIINITGFQGVVNTVEWSPDGGKIAALCGDSLIRIYDVETGNKILDLSGHLGEVNSVSWNPNGSRLASGGISNLIKIWDISNGKEIKTILAHPYSVNVVSWSPDGSKIASGSNQGSLKIWDASTWLEIKRINVYNGSIVIAAWNHDGTKLASYGNNRTIIWDVNTGNEIISSGTSINSNAGIFWNPDGSKIAGIGFNAAVKIMDASSFSELKSLKGHSWAVENVTWSPDGAKIASNGRDSSVVIWDAIDPSELKEVIVQEDNLEWSPDGTKIASYGYPMIRIWSPDTGKEISTIPDVTMLQDLCWSPDGTKIVYGGYNRNIKVHDISTGNAIWTAGSHQTSYVLGWSPDGSNIASAGTDKKIKIWDAVNGNHINTIDGNEIFLSICWSPDGTRVAAGGKKNIFIYDLSGNLVKTLSGSEEEYYSVDWSPDGRKIISGGDSEQVKIWDYDSGIISEILTGHSNIINEVAWSMDGYRIASASSDGTVRIWNYNIPLQEDISDSLFSIGSTDITGKDVDLLEHCAGSDKPKVTMIRDYITNTSKFKLSIDSLVPGGTDTADFKIHHRSVPFLLYPGESADVTFNFRPETPGVKTAEVNIHYQGGILTKNLTAVAVDCGAEVLSRNIDFGKVLIGETKDTTVFILKNRGSNSINISQIKLNGPDTKQFSIISSGGAFTLDPGESREMAFSFMPEMRGRTNCILVFHHDETGSPAEALLFGEGVMGCDESAFAFDDFRNANSILFAGEASNADDALRLTPPKELVAGAAWYATKVPVASGFSTTFSFRMDHGTNGDAIDGSYPGADGIAFVIQNSDSLAIGKTGGNIGYESIENALAVEFDLFANDHNQITNKFDPDGNHIAIQSMGINKNTADHTEDASFGVSSEIPEIRSDGTVYFAKIEYNYQPGIMNVFIDTTGEFQESSLVAARLHLDELLEPEAGEGAYIGFTSATGKAYQQHEILSWYFCPVPTDGPFTSVHYEPLYIKGSGFDVYPNPAEDKLDISLSLTESGFTELAIFNVMGEKVQTVIAENISTFGSRQFSADVSELGSGQYMLILKTPTHVDSRKVVVIR